APDYVSTGSRERQPKEESRTAAERSDARAGKERCSQGLRRPEKRTACVFVENARCPLFHFFQQYGEQERQPPLAEASPLSRSRCLRVKHYSATMLVQPALMAMPCKSL